MINLSKLNKNESLELFKTGGEWLLNLLPQYSLTDKLFNKSKLLNDLKNNSRLYGDNKNRLLELFGKQLFCYTTWYRSYNWFFEYQGLIIGVSCSIRGTDYRVYNSNIYNIKKVNKIVKSFVDDFIDTIHCGIEQR